MMYPSKKRLLLLMISLFAVLTLLTIGLLTDYSITHSVLKEEPRNVRITNITDNAFTLSWVTDNPSIGYVVYAEAEEFNNSFPLYKGFIAIDDKDYYRKEEDVSYQYMKGYSATKNEIIHGIKDKELGKKYNSHHVTVRNLEPDTRYSFKISDGESYQLESSWFSKDQFNYNVNTSVETLSQSDQYKTPKFTYGSIVSDEDLIDFEGVAFFNIEYKEGQSQGDNFIPLSSVVSNEGIWGIDLSNIRDSKGVSWEYESKIHYSKLLIEDTSRRDSSVIDLPSSLLDAPVDLAYKQNQFYIPKITHFNRFESFVHGESVSSDTLFDSNHVSHLDDTEFTLKLNEGINLIPLPILNNKGEIYKATELLDELRFESKNLVTHLASYDYSLNRWNVTIADNKYIQQGVDFNIIPGKGYLVISEADATVKLGKSIVVESEGLYLSSPEGLISLPRDTVEEKIKASKLLTEIFDTSDGTIIPSEITWWNPVFNKFDSISVDFDQMTRSVYGDDFLIDPQFAYFITVKQGCGEVLLDQK